ncbi:MAG: toll/interleukin-1 receptor domain-containing protein [Candidatus Angelobacter sp.]
MANPEHVNILEEGVETWNKWRETNSSIVPNLAKADLSRVDLRGANLYQANLGGANFDGAQLSRANLSGANLSRANLNRVKLSRAKLRAAALGGTDFHKAELTSADLSGAQLTNANLSEARLTRADLSRTLLCGTYFSSVNLKEVNFTDSMMVDTILADVDLSQAKGLETVKHYGPSTIGFDTIQRSQGKIPDVFLRGAGVSDEFIAFIRAMGGAIQFYSCFISYSSKDQLFAERLYADLQARGVRCWFAPHDVQGGKKLHEQIDDAIRVHERLLLILSPESINSEWVKTEIAKARKREVMEKRRMLFPVLLKISYKELQEWECFDADTGKDSAREIREYYIPDFSQWERPEKFKEEFEKLVRDLKKAAGKAGAEAG